MDDRPITITSFEQFLTEGKLMATKCRHCGALWCPPRPVCNKCSSSEMEWQEMSGKGKLATFTIIGVGTALMLEAGYNRENPYCAGIVELEEGPKISAQILGVDTSNPENINIGIPLQKDFVERGTFSFSSGLKKVPKTYLAFRTVEQK